MDELHEKVTALLNHPADRAVTSRNVLKVVLEHFQSETGTIHMLGPERQWLHLAAECGLPPAMLKMVELIPVGKGIAGQTVERGGPVTICNLQTDTSGVAPPGARQTGVGSALCVPIRNGGIILGTIGIGTVRQHEYTPEETKRLEDVGRWIGAAIKE